MSFAVLAFLAGLLSVLAPCVLPILPVILWWSLGTHKHRRPLIIVGSTVFFIIVFTVLLKVSSLLINVPEWFRTSISALIIIGYGVTLITPNLREHYAQRLGLSRTQELAQQANKHEGIWWDILLGAALWPIFASCSPTYALLLSLVFPESFTDGLIYTTIYALGFGALLLLIAYSGRALVKKLNWLADPHGRFKRTLGAVLIMTGVLIATWRIKKIETFFVQYDIFNATTLEGALIENSNIFNDTASGTSSNGKDLLNTNYPAPEFQWLEHRLNIWNDTSLTLAQLRGKVILVDFWTYSCINCIRTLPYLRMWNEKYSSQWLVILGIHAPEFQFEKLPQNVKRAVKKFDIAYPVAQDNDLKTRRAFRNQYRPAKYIIDKEGNVRYTHFGEGNYEETEQVIRTLLLEKNTKNTDINSNTTQTEPNANTDTSSNNNIASQIETPDFSKIWTAETYLGLERRETVRGTGPAAYIPYDAQSTQEPLSNTRRLSGTRASSREFITLTSTGGWSISLNFSAKTAKLVMWSIDDKPIRLDIYVDGKLTQTLTITSHELYTVYTGNDYSRHTIELRFRSPGVLAYAFTFG